MVSLLLLLLLCVGSGGGVCSAAVDCLHMKLLVISSGTRHMRTVVGYRIESFDVSTIKINKCGTEKCCRTLPNFTEPY